MRRSTSKRALLTSVMALFLCFTMLLGTTFAWFTDSASSTGNKIVAGTLDVNLLMYDATQGKYVDISESAAPIFGDGALAGNDRNTKWEPGKTQVVYLAIENAGNLDLKYDVLLSVTDSVNDLYKAMRYTITPDAMATDAALPAWDAATAKEVVPGTQTVSDADVLLGAEKTHYFALSIHMLEEAGNEFQKGEITFDLTVRAAQVASEEDSFGNDYDQVAPYPTVQSVIIPENTTEPTTITVGDVTLTVPAGAEAGSYMLKIANENETVTNGKTTVDYDITLYLNGEKASGENYPVTINVGTLLDVEKVTHNGVEISTFDYDPLTGIVSFATDSFSPFAVIYTPLDVEDAVIEDCEKITAGDFGFNPATLDPSLAEADSAYIAINYVKNGETRYVVADRATTVVLAGSDTVYTAENGNYTAKPASGKLWSEISALQSNAHSTVYLLPGTYNEGTTINVYSSMDIIGLGDKDAVKVIKLSSSNSNRHLFNCNGTKADYIQVTLRNLYLDATAKTTGGKDNAAVQSIRKTKVKCYDLTLVKGSGWGSYAFYHNGTNTVAENGANVVYPGYLYAENCMVVSGTVADTGSGNSRFYHYNVTYNNGANVYTSNSGRIYNKQMAPDDWTWD